MSVLNSIFNRTTFGTRCKTCCNLAISRIKLLRNKREAQLKHMRREISEYLRSGQEAIARIRVEHIIREQNIMAAYEILELFCEFVLARVPILEAQRDCPLELQEATASIIFASPRCSDLPELMQIRNLFIMKYGKEYVSAASELRPDSNVNRLIIEKLSASAPPADVKLKTMKGIAQEFMLDWDSSSTEAEFSKKHEDLLDGSPTITTQVQTIRSSSVAPPLTNGPSVPQHPAPASMVSINTVIRGEDVSPSISSPEPVDKNGEINSNIQGSSDVMERARAAIAAAERATAAARAAAQLVNVRAARQPCNGDHIQ